MAAKKDFVVKNGLVVGTTQDSATSGQLSWNASEGTVDLSLQNGVTLQLGQEQHFYAKATEAISNGEVVMFAGAEGDHLLISKADVTTPGFIDEWVVGVATQDFALNDFGYATSFGKVNELDTQTPGWSAGDLLYLDVSTPGGLTTTRPTSPDPEILIAAVVRVNPTQGSIFVRPDYGMDLTNIHDVLLDSATLTNNQFLIYDSASQVWSNQTPTTSIIGEGTNLYYTKARVDSDVQQGITALIDGAPTALDTLNELAAALNDDANFAATITNQIAALPDSAEVSAIITADVDKAFVDALNVDADTLDTQDGTYYLDYTNFTNTPNVLDSADVLATVSAGGYATQTYVDNAVDALPDSAQVSLIITADVDKAFVDALNVDADTLDGQNGTYYLDYNNFTNTPAAGLDSAAVTTIAEDVSLALAIALG